MHRRSNSNKFSKYIQSSAREEFISYNSGGFFKNEIASRHLSPNQGLSQTRKPLQKSSSLPEINAKLSTYHANGTGRDIYICLPLQATKCPDSNFYSSLRSKPTKYQPVSVTRVFQSYSSQARFIKRMSLPKTYQSSSHN